MSLVDRSVIMIAMTTSSTFRPPAVPLVAVDPYFSIWSFDDKLTTSPTRHWTGTGQPLCAYLRLDGKNYRIMGAWPEALPALAQKSVEVFATRTVYIFEDAGIRLTLTFLTPALPDDLTILSWPITYIDFAIQSLDKKKHSVGIYFEAPGELCVDTPNQAVVAGRTQLEGLNVLSIGSADQRVLGRSGDNLRIDWGQAYLVIPEDQFQHTLISTYDVARESFLAGKPWPGDDAMDFPESLQNGWAKLATATSFELLPNKEVSRYLILAYDDRFCIEYHHRKLRPYWRTRGLTPATLFRAAASQYKSLRARCEAFDRELAVDLDQVGGKEYAQLAILSYRQCLAAHKLCEDIDGTLLYFSKENFSNGCLDTVDVTYPSAPFFLLFCPELLRAQLIPILDYAESSRWKFAFAPHDLGCYPLANGQVYGGAEASEKDQMPVEECGNMLILVAALCQRTKDWSDAKRYASLLKKWADYLVKFGLDPANQLCTDDFAGHFARNANLSIKAIIGLRCYAELCHGTGDKKSAARFTAIAKKFLKAWEKLADDGDHSNLAFGKKDTWSQKYNLVWDKLLSLNLVPKSLIERDLAYYRTMQQKYGLPLDVRKNYTKIDWTIWTATMASSDQIFQEFISPLYQWANETEARVPLTDWHWTDSGKQAGFQARSVVGGLFIKLLADAKLAKKWTQRGVGSKR